MRILKSYFAFLAVFLIIDMIWIAVFAGNFYQQQLSGVLKDTLNFSLVGPFYLCYAAGALYLCVRPAQYKHHALLSGAIFGAISYGTFSVTNYTLINGWTMPVVITDVLWGAFITAISSLASYQFYSNKPD